ncbi:hypothetical protein EJB05_30068, partial [Eragrostis curvula]
MEMELLSDDLLANILGRLPPCSLAACRCVRKDWCAVIDARRLLRADLLPLRLDGFFCVADQPDTRTYCFFRRSTNIDLQFLQGDDDYYDDQGITDHCNGLLLFWDRVANPATRQWTPLPPSPPLQPDDFFDDFFLAYDPIVSPHCYEVLRFPLLPTSLQVPNIVNFPEDSEWPPSPFTTHAFSSTTSSWEERSFVRQGDATGTIADMRSDWQPWNRHAVYFRGALYVHCQNNSVMRIALNSSKYQMIIPPAGNRVLNDGVVCLGKSEKGVYFSLLREENENGWPQFQVWFLNDHMEWVSKNNISLQAVVENFPFDTNDRYNRPWIVNENGQRVNEARAQDDQFEWDFDNGIILPVTKDDKVITYSNDIVFLGFHPYKEIAFFLVSSSRVVSYHLNTSRVQELGILTGQTIVKSFPYTPCWMGMLTENN